MEETIAIERALRRLTRGAHLARLHQRLSQAAGVSIDRPAYIALACLTELGPLPLSALAEASSVEVSTMSRLVDRLVAEGLVEARRSPTDQRVTLLDLSPAGAHVVDQLKAVRRAALEEIIAGWTPAERETFARLLSRLADGIETIAAPRATRRPAGAARAGAVEGEEAPR